MDLVIGGAFQGKRAAVRQLFQIEEKDLIDGRTCSRSELYACRGVHHFQEYIRRAIRDGEAVDTLAEDLFEKNPDILIVSEEIGYGIVPLDAAERLWREQTGRICCQIAGYASHVVRVVAGIGAVIKGSAL